MFKAGFIVIMFTIASPTLSLASSKPVTSTTPGQTESPEMTKLMNRLEEIKAMDTRGMSRLEKRTLRQPDSGSER